MKCHCNEVEELRVENDLLREKLDRVEALMRDPHGPRSMGGIHLPQYVLVTELRRALHA